MSWNVLAGPSQTLLAAAILQTEDECRTCSNGDLLTLNTLFMISNYELWCFLARLTPHWKLHCKYLRKKIIAALWRVCPCKTVFFVGSSRPVPGSGLCVVVCEECKWAAKPDFYVSDFWLGMAPRVGRRQAGTWWLMVGCWVTALTSVIRADTRTTSLTNTHTSLSFYLSLNWLVLWRPAGKHVNYAKIIAAQARNQEEKMKLTRKTLTKHPTHKFYESLTYSTAIMSCLSLPPGSGYTQALSPPPTGLFWAEFLILRCMKIWNGDLHEKKRSTALGVENAEAGPTPTRVPACSQARQLQSWA